MSTIPTSEDALHRQRDIIRTVWYVIQYSEDENEIMTVIKSAIANIKVMVLACTHTRKNRIQDAIAELDYLEQEYQTYAGCIYSIHNLCIKMELCGLTYLALIEHDIATIEEMKVWHDDCNMYIRLLNTRGDWGRYRDALVVGVNTWIDRENDLPVPEFYRKELLLTRRMLWEH